MNTLSVLDAPWAMGSEDYRTLLRAVNQRTQGVVLELGSGKSTLMLAKDLPEASLRSLENDRIYQRETAELLRRAGYSSACVMLSQIRMQFCKGAPFVTYDFDEAAIKGGIVILLIDGPVERLYPMGREAALYFLFDRLSIGCVVALDDYHRASSKEAVSNWRLVFGKSILVLDETESFVVLKKVGHSRRKILPLGVLVRSYWRFCIGLVRRTRRLVSSALIRK